MGYKQNQINIIQVNEEFARITFEAIALNLKDQGFHAEVIEHPQGGFVMMVPVLGPDHVAAEFRMISSDGDGWDMQAIYITSLLPDGYMELWNLGTTPDIDNLSEESVPDFIHKCLVEEHEQFCKLTLIVDDNKLDFLHLLPDEALTEEGVYSIGVIVDEEGGPVPAGALTFSFEDRENVNIETIFVDEEYRDIGIATYMIYKLADLLDEE